MGLTAAERWLKWLLNVLVGVFLLAALVYELGALVGPLRGFFRQLPFVSNSVVKVSLMGLLCLYAAGDVRRRIGLVGLVILGHVLSVAAMLVLLGLSDTQRLVALGARTTTVGNLLWGAIALDGFITLVVLVFYALAKRAARAQGQHQEPPTAPRLTSAERWMRGVLIAFGALFALAAVGYELGPLWAPVRDFFVELPFVTNSVVKVGTLALLCFYVCKDLRGNLPLVTLLIVAHVVSAGAQAVFLLATDTGYTVTLGTRSVALGAVLWGSIALDGGITLVLFLCARAAWKARFGALFFAPMEYRALIALADVVVRGKGANDEKVPAADVAANVDGYVSQIRARRRWVYHVMLVMLQLHPLLYLRAPLSELDAATRLRHLRKHFMRDVLLPNIPDWWRRIVQVCIRVGKQLVYVGYYNDPRSFESLGYVPFSRRPRARHLKIPERAPHPLRVERPGDLRDTTLEADVCIVGSGAGGAILAYYLAKQGRQVLVLERGQYVEPREFTEDEVEMIGRLYADGAFQQTQDWRFTVLQGSCVGGTTVVNNAVCFPPPDHVLARWNDPALHDAGLDLGALRRSVDEVVRFLPITSQNGVRLNPSFPEFLLGVERFKDGLKAVGQQPPSLEVGVVHANIKDCFGCGYCNIGCAFGKKLSMLDTALPWAQRDFPGKVRIVAECEVERIRTLSGPIGRVTDLRARLSDGRKVTIRARTYVVSAGAIASSYLLMRSGVGRDLPVGEHLCFNMGAALTAEFDEKMDAYDGLQISHYGRPDPERGWVYETWWNPPVAQAINQPGWFEDHFENMRRYPWLMAAGVLAGTAGNARVRQALTGGPDIAYRPEPRDLAKLSDGLKTLGYILFAAGARRVMANTWSGDVFTTPDQLARMDELVDPKQMALGTGHPQGGNAISQDPRRGVVGPDFRVHGYSNLYVCDASVFPSSLTVNPQQTVMTLAHYASSRIR